MTNKTILAIFAVTALVAGSLSFAQVYAQEVEVEDPTKGIFKSLRKFLKQLSTDIDELKKSISELKQDVIVLKNPNVYVDRTRDTIVSEFQVVNASCDEGDFLLTGGFNISDRDNFSVRTSQMIPDDGSADPDTWHVIFTGLIPNPGEYIESYVYCIDNEPLRP